MQHLSNALFAWAVLTATTEQGSTPSMDACAQRLFVEVNSRCARAFGGPPLRSAPVVL